MEPPIVTQRERKYLPAAGRDWLLPLYDPLVALMGVNAARRLLLDQAGLAAGDRVLEVGCGTGSLLLLASRMRRDAVLTGLDPDPNALARAARKAKAARVTLSLDRGFADALPYPDASFDRVLSCLMLHHISGTEGRRRALAEMARVLRPGGRLHLLDFTHGRSLGGKLLEWLHPSQEFADNADERVVALMTAGGLTARLVSRGSLLTMPTAYYEAVAPER